METKDQEIYELKSIINTMLIEQALLTADVSILEDLLFDLINKTLIEKDNSTLYTSYVDNIEKTRGEAIDSIPSLLFDIPGALSYIQRLRFDLFSSIRELKEDPHYTSNS
jgi:hypothetical protein